MKVKLIIFYETVFQQMDCDYHIVSNPTSEILKQLGSHESKIPVIRLFGVTAEGHSVLANVYGFMPYFYVPVPPEFKSMDEYLVCRIVKDSLNVRVMIKYRI